MTGLTGEIISRFLVRKTKKQKLAFREFLCPELEKLGYDVHVEEAGFPRTANIVVGDPDSARMVFSAHYDTCPVLPFPNFITPKNIPLYIVWQLLLSVAILAVAGAVALLFDWIFDGLDLGALVGWLSLWVMLIMMVVGPANKTTMNDNTSGVVALVELMSALPADVRDRVAFVFFDLEEAGLIGSANFAQKHKELKCSTPLVNLDCVSDGSNLLLVQSRALLKDEQLCEKIRESFNVTDEYNLLFSKGSKTIYPSDQANFKKTLAIAALNKSKLLGYYMDKIHTRRDTVFCEANIEYITTSLARLVVML